MTGAVSGTGTASLDGSATFEVTATRPVRLVRSASWYPGWTATIASTGGGPTFTRPVTAHSGLLQSVVVPAGRWRVSFTYHPPGALPGLTSSALGLLAVIGFLVWGRSYGRPRSASTGRAPEKSAPNERQALVG